MEICSIDNLLEICLLLPGIQCSIPGQLFNKIAVNHFQGVLPSEGLGLLLHPGPSILPRKGRANPRHLLLQPWVGTQQVPSNKWWHWGKQNRDGNPCRKGNTRRAAAMLKWGWCHHHPAAPVTAGGAMASTTTLYPLQILHLFNLSFPKSINSFLARHVVGL